VYQRIVQGKDLVADVLPPPAYILESYLTVLQLAQAKNADKTAHIKKLQALKADFDRRHVFWSQMSLEGELAKALLKQAHDPAVTFFNIGFEEFVPAVLADDDLKASSALARMRDFYLEHREAIDLVVQLTEQRNLAAETKARTSISTAYQVLLALLAFCMAAGIGFAMLVIRSLMQSLGGEPSVLGEASRKIAGGDLDFELNISPNDQHSVLHQIERMRQQLKERIALEKAQKEADIRVSKAEAELRISEQKAKAEKEKQEIYESMTSAAQHVLNNLLNQLQLFKMAADSSHDFDRSILELYDGVTAEAIELIARLSSVTDLNHQNILASVAPKE
jgi:signal transduction histidine kinase